MQRFGKKFIMDDNVFMILCRSYFPDCVFYRGGDSTVGFIISVWNKEAQDALEKTGQLDYSKLKFHIHKDNSPKYGDVITCSCPFSCRKAYLSEKSFIKLLKSIKKYYNGTV